MEKSQKLKTKDKILLAAIEQYNKVGVQSITSRHIAGEMGISHGNLDYHYKNKEDIILAIYKKMRAEMSESYSTRREKTSSLEHFHLLLIQLEEFQYRYRFFNYDVLEISRSFPKVSKLLQKTFELRKQQMQNLFLEFKNDGFSTLSEGEPSERVQHIIRIIITFWLSQREVLASFKFTEKGEMVRSVWTVLKPYLTETGKDEKRKTIETYGYVLKESNNEE